ncbi:MAG: TIGR04086 family membrane protein [Ruminococcus sp.]|nr:TIGR04086 family membrane protein [Ruminococcus sp.]
MKHRYKRFKSCFWDSRFCCTVGAVAAGLFVMLLFLTGFSILIANLDASDDMVSCMAAIALCAGSFIAGYIAAKHRRRHGLLIGLLCGVIMYFCVFFFGLIVLRSFSGAGTLMKLVLVLLCSCIGGVCGVNTNIKKPPH